jgi:hypothetical protein
MRRTSRMCRAARPTTSRNTDRSDAPVRVGFRALRVGSVAVEDDRPTRAGDDWPRFI